MFAYTKATLKDFLKLWVEGNGDDAEEQFIDDLDEIIQRGELRVMRDLDLEVFDYVRDTATSATVPEVWKPENMVVDRLVVVSIDGRKRQLKKRSRAFVDAMNRDDTNGEPLYYAELDEERWTLAPIPSDAWLVYVHAQFRPASIIDGDDDTTTWLSTRLPDILAGACAIEAAHQLKNWNRKAVEEAAYIAKLDDARAQTLNLRRTDVGEIIGGRDAHRNPTIAPEPAATV